MDDDEIPRDWDFGHDGPGIKCDVFNIRPPDASSTGDTLELIRRYYPAVPMLCNSSDPLADPQAPAFNIRTATRELGDAPRFTWRDAFW